MPGRLDVTGGLERHEGNFKLKRLVITVTPVSK